MNVSGPAAANTVIAQPLAASTPSQPSPVGTSGSATGPAAAAKSDSVSLSPLAKSLHDESLTVFNALSTEQRSALSALVDSGKMTGDEVHNALKERLKEARTKAYGAGFRMFANDSAGLYFGDQPPSIDDMRDALRGTLERRSALFDRMTSLEKDGKAGTDEHSALAKELAASDMNPLLTRKPPDNRAMLSPFHGIDTRESRLMKTKTEVNAFEKLRDSGFDIAGLDARLRGLGEKDAQAIVAEQAKLSGYGRVAEDREFSIDDASVRLLDSHFAGAGAQDTEAMSRINEGRAFRSAADQGADAVRSYLKSKRTNVVEVSSSVLTKL